MKKIAIFILSVVFLITAGCQKNATPSDTQSTSGKTDNSAYSDILSGSGSVDSTGGNYSSIPTITNSNGVSSSLSGSANSSVTGGKSSTVRSAAGSSSHQSLPDGNKLIVCDIPEETPTDRVMFQVKINGREAGVYSDINAWNQNVNFAYFNLTDGYTVSVEITANFSFSSVSVLPASLGIKPSVNGRKLNFQVSKTNLKMSFVFDNNYTGTTLHLFTNPIDLSAPVKSDNNTLFFGPGYYDLNNPDLDYGGQISLHSGQTLYLAPGAVINGPVEILNAKNVTIKGSGVIMMTRKNAVNPQYGNICVTVNNSSEVHLQGIIVNSHRLQNWTTHLYYSKNVQIDNYKVISPRYASTDALDISNCQGITVTNSFLRACDDTITIKGLAGDSVAPSNAVANENIHVSGCILWNDCNNAMVLGEESRAKYYQNISFRNIDVLFSYDDRDNHEDLDERSVMTICCLQGTYFRDVTWEDIRVNQCERLICLTFKDSYWFGSLAGNQSYPGSISGITFKNITSKTTSKSSIANEILLHGWSADKTISNITFDHVMTGNNKLTSGSNITKNQYVSNLIFK